MKEIIRCAHGICRGRYAGVFEDYGEELKMWLPIWLDPIAHAGVGRDGITYLLTHVSCVLFNLMSISGCEGTSVHGFSEAGRSFESGTIEAPLLFGCSSIPAAWIPGHFHCMRFRD